MVCNSFESIWPSNDRFHIPGSVSKALVIAIQSSDDQSPMPADTASTSNNRVPARRGNATSQNPVQFGCRAIRAYTNRYAYNVAGTSVIPMMTSVSTIVTRKKHWFGNEQYRIVRNLLFWFLLAPKPPSVPKQTLTWLEMVVKRQIFHISWDILGDMANDIYLKDLKKV